MKTSDKLTELNSKMGDSYKILKSPRFLTGFGMNFMYFIVLIFFNICTANFNFNAVLTLGFWTKMAMNILLLILGLSWNN